MRGYSALIVPCIALCLSWSAYGIDLPKVELDERGKVKTTEDAPGLESHELPPAEASLLGLGRFAHQALQNGGYAYGALRSVEVSPRDKDVDKVMKRNKAGFPVRILLRVDDVTLGKGDNSAAELIDFEITVHLQKDKFEPPGLAVLEALRLGPVPMRLDIPLPPAASFLDRNERIIKTMLGILTLTSIVRMTRTLVERWWQRRKKRKEEAAAAAATAASTPKAVAAAPTAKGKGKPSKKND